MASSVSDIVKEIDFSPLEEFEFWLTDMEEKLVQNVRKPATREEACKLLTAAKKLQSECRNHDIPEELDSDEGDEKAEELAGRYNLLLATVEENIGKTETLCVTWDKLNSDVVQLKSALNSGGGSSLTFSKLESSLAEIKEMFKERASIIDNLTPGSGY